MISVFYWVVLLAFDPDQPFVAGLAVASVTALGMTVPSSPGYIGVFEVLTRETMVLFGMAPEAALSYALVAHAIVYVVYTLLGLVGMVQQNMSYCRNSAANLCGGADVNVKVLFVLTYYHPHVSGLTIYVKRLATALAQRATRSLCSLRATMRRCRPKR